jgi:hypothetical protein
MSDEGERKEQRDAGESQEGVPNEPGGKAGDKDVGERPSNSPEEKNQAPTGEGAGKKRVRRIVALSIIAVLLVSGIALTIALNNRSTSVESPKAQPDETTTIPKQDVPKTSESENAADGDVDDDADGADTVEGDGLDNTDEGGEGAGVSTDPPKSSGGGSTSGAPGGTSGGNTNRVWHEGWDEWVIDAPGHYEQRLVRAAWDERKGHYGSICNDCDTEVTGNYPAHVEATGHMGGYTNNHWFDEGTVHHDAVYENVWVSEQGHWEWHEGYWE